MTFCNKNIVLFANKFQSKCCLSLNPQPLFLKGCRHSTFFKKKNLVLPGGFSPFFSLRKKEATTTSPKDHLVDHAVHLLTASWWELSACGRYLGLGLGGDRRAEAGMSDESRGLVSEGFGGWVWGGGLGVDGGGVYTFDIWNCGVSMVWIACECAIWATKKRSVRSCFLFKELSNWVGWERKKSSTKTPSQAALQEMSLQSAAEKCLQQKTKGDKMLPTNTLTKAGFSNIPLKFLTFQWIFQITKSNTKKHPHQQPATSTFFSLTLWSPTSSPFFSPHLLSPPKLTWNPQNWYPPGN